MANHGPEETCPAPVIRNSGHMFRQVQLHWRRMRRMTPDLKTIVRLWTYQLESRTSAGGSSALRAVQLHIQDGRSFEMM
jgi:hypothetical protein